MILVGVDVDDGLVIVSVHSNILQQHAKLQGNHLLETNLGDPSLTKERCLWCCHGTEHVA
jgi:hypothetical protein